MPKDSILISAFGKLPNIKMVLLFLQLQLFGYAWGLPPNFERIIEVNQNPRIIGGRPYKIEEVPYQVSVQLFNHHVCGGSLISPNYILTAAHCSEVGSKSSFSIVAGSNRSDTGGIRRKVLRIDNHPLYNRYTLDYDIAVLLLTYALFPQNGIQPTKLVEANKIIPANRTAVVTGWGHRKEEGETSKQLFGVKVLVVNHTDCLKVYRNYLTERMLCAGYKQGGKDACQHDSGGPLVTSEDGQIGVVSWGHRCAQPGYYGVYANVTVMRQWIHSVTGI